MAIALFVIPSFSDAKIILVLGAGVDQNTANRTVFMSDCANSEIYVSCFAGGSSTCPTNAKIREACPGALVVNWLPMTNIDQDVSTVQGYWNGGSGTQNGLYSQQYTNVSTGENVRVDYAWITLGSGALQITIDVVVL